MAITKKLRKAWNTGKKLSEIHKKNLSLSHIGKKHTEEQKRKIREANKGKHFHKVSKESIAKMRLSMLGKHHTQESRKKMSEAQKGEKSYLWKGGIAQLKVYKHYRNLEYKLWREAVFSRDNWTCQKCGQRSGKGRPLVIHPHHIKSYTYYPKIRYEVSNGITLCVSCHHIEHFGH